MPAFTLPSFRGSIVDHIPAAASLRRWHHLKETGATLVFYTLLAIVFTWPAMQRLNTHLIGRTSDSMVHYWNGWWVGQALAQGQSPFFSQLLNFPDGASLVTHNFAWTNIAAWLLLSPVAGGVAAYNLIIILFLVICGLSLFWLFLELTGDFLPALLAGTIYMLWPYRLSQLDHPNLVATFFIPITLLFLLRTVRYSRWLDAILAGVFLALVGYTRWQLLLPMVFILPVFLLGVWLAKEVTWSRQVVLQLGASFLAAGVLLLPPALMLYDEQQSSNLAADVFYAQDEELMSVDFIAYFTPASRHFIFKDITEPLYENYYPERSSGRRYPAFIGNIVLIIGFVGLATDWRRTWSWLLLAIIMAGLAAGLVTHIGGQTFEGLPTLYDLLSPLQFPRLMREPERYLMFLALPVGMLFGYGWQYLALRSPFKRLFLLMTPLMLLMIIFLYLALPSQMIAVDFDRSAERALRMDEAPGAVLNLPLRYRFSKEFMFGQTLHKRPILQGHVSREPENLYRFLESAPFLDEINALPSDPAHLLAQMQESNISHLLLNKTMLGEISWQFWREVVPYDPLYEDDRVLLYATRPHAAADQEPALMAGRGLGLLGHEIQTFCSDERTLAVVRLQWTAVSDSRPDYLLYFRAEGQGEFGFNQARTLPIADNWPTSEWPSGAISRQVYFLELPAGASGSVTGQLIDGASGRLTGEMFDLGRLQEYECTQVSGFDNRSNIRFGDEITLLAYQRSAAAGKLTLSFMWLANQRPTANYKVFVHLLEPNSCDLVAQVDAIPQQWQFPTVQWQAGELVSDEITLDLSRVPSGTYRLSLGLYDADNGQRLPVTVGSNQFAISGDNCLVLRDSLFVSQESEH